jgi:hypothetical protein
MKHSGTLAILLTTMGTLSGAAFAAQGSPTKAPESPKAVWELFSLANQSPESFPYYLQLLPIGDPGADSIDGDLKATLDAELGLYDQAIATFPKAVNDALDPSPLPAGDAKVTDAADIIVRLARDRRVVIVNEAHHVAQTRALFLELLPRLREMGFTEYCAETLDIGDAPNIHARGYPLRTDGLYSREPVFGEVVRTATQLGYTLCGYDFDARQQNRETGQARTLAALLRDNPKARVLIHAGYNHARKASMSHYSPMALELRRLTGIDPLTVDQTALRPDIPASRESPAYRKLSTRLKGARRASVFVAANGKPWSLEPKSYDVSVILPTLPPAHGRAGWLWEIPGRQVVTDFDADCMGHYPCAIEARHAGESDDAVPADVVVHGSADQAVPALALAPGGYRLRIVAPDGSKLRETDLTVADSGNTPWN